MINISCVKTGWLQTNTYIVYLDNRAVLIDPGDEPQKIDSALKNLNLVCENIIFTHGHFDHINAAYFFIKNGAKTAIHAEDVCLVNGQQQNGSKYGIKINTFSPDITFLDGECLNFCGINFKILHTPGHTKGSVCIILEDNIFSGDTLFYRDIGNSGNFADSEKILVNSIKTKLYTLKNNYKIYPGHGIATTLDDEKNFNPYVRI